MLPAADDGRGSRKVAFALLERKRGDWAWAAERAQSRADGAALGDAAAAGGLGNDLLLVQLQLHLGVELPLGWRGALGVGGALRLVVVLVVPVVLVLGGVAVVGWQRRELEPGALPLHAAVREVGGVGVGGHEGGRGEAGAQRRVRGSVRGRGGRGGGRARGGHG